MSGVAGSRPVPEAWVGRSVELVFVSGSSTEYADGRLREVNDRGIVLTVEGHGEHPARPPVLPVGRRHPARGDTGLTKEATRVP